MKAAIAVLVAVTCLLAYFAENIYGYYRFRELCKADGGLHVSRPLRVNVGWTINDSQIEAAGFPLSFEQVSFVRYRSKKDGELHDVQRAPKLKVGDPGYAAFPVDLGKDVIYRFEVLTVGRIPNESRLGVQHFTVYDAKSGEVQVRYSRFGYSKFDQDRTLLGAPSGVGCPEDITSIDPLTGKRVPSKLEMAFASAFEQR